MIGASVKVFKETSVPALTGGLIIRRSKNGFSQWDHKCDLKLGCDISLSKFSEFFGECLFWCSPSKALSRCAIQAVTSRLHIAV